MISWKGVVLQTKVKPQTKGTVLLVCWECTDILLFASKHAKGESTEKVEKRDLGAVGNGKLWLTPCKLACERSLETDPNIVASVGDGRSW